MDVSASEHQKTLWFTKNVAAPLKVLKEKVNLQKICFYEEANV